MRSKPITCSVPHAMHLPPGLRRSAIVLCVLSGIIVSGGSPAAAKPCAALDVPCQLKVIQDRLQAFGQSLSALSSKVVDSAKRTVEVADQVKAVKKFSDALLETADHALALAKQGTQVVAYHVSTELAECQQFVGADGNGACNAFRDELVAFITSIETTTNGLLRLERALATTSGVDVPELRIPDLDLSAIKKALGAMPGFILYPAYKALSIARAGEKVTLKPLIDIVEAIKAETAVTKNIVDVFADCPSVRAPAIRAKLVGMSQKLKLANGVKLFAELLKAMGKTSANGTAGGLAAGGHLSLKIEHDFASSLGSFLGGFADIALAIAKSIDARLDHCELVVNQETIMRQLESPRGTSREQCRPTPKFTQFDF